MYVKGYTHYLGLTSHPRLQIGTKHLLYYCTHLVRFVVHAKVRAIHVREGGGGAEGVVQTRIQGAKSVARAHSDGMRWQTQALRAQRGASSTNGRRRRGNPAQRGLIPLRLPRFQCCCSERLNSLSPPLTRVCSGDAVHGRGLQCASRVGVHLNPVCGDVCLRVAHIVHDDLQNDSTRMDDCA